MPRYILKQYNRPSYPERTVGVLAQEWMIDAPDDKAAIEATKMELVDFRPPEDFAILWDANGKLVWEEVRA